jgi:hypothetical protein
MKRLGALTPLAGLVLLACGSNGTSGPDLDATTTDAAAEAGGAESGLRDGGAPADAPPLDTGAPMPCAQGDACGAGLQCLCCGSIGPRAICLCTTACTTSGQCADPARPACNTPGPGADGICTAQGFNCCWRCQ